MNSTLGRWILILLFISLLLNMGIVGFVIKSNFTKDTNNTSAVLPSDMSNVFNQIPSENRKQFIDTLKDRQQQITYNERQIMLIRLEIAQLIQKEKYDQKRLSELFESMTELRGKNVELNQQTLYQTILVLPLAERIKIAKALSKVQVKKRVPFEGAKATRFDSLPNWEGNQGTTID